MHKTIRNGKKEWEETTLNKVLQRFPERKEIFTTGSDKEVERLYLPDEETKGDYLEKIGFPASIPTHGVYSRQCTGDGSGQ